MKIPKCFAAILASLAAVALSLAFTPTASAEFGLKTLDGGSFDALGDPSYGAGSHPHAFVTDFSFNIMPSGRPEPAEVPVEDIREVRGVTPPGLIGNPTAVPTCTGAEFYTPTSTPTETLQPNCPPETRLGTSMVTYVGPEGPSNGGGLYNLKPPFGVAAKFGFYVTGVAITIDATLTRTPPYRVLVRATDIAQIVPVFASKLDFWGVPAAEAHDGERHGPSSAPELPFLSLPTSCEGPIRTDLEFTSWLGSTDQGFFLSEDALGNPLPISGCEALSFEPALEARPTTNLADSPSGLDVDLHVPQNDDPAGTATAHLRHVTVTLPEGLTVNPASANGLAACSAAQVDLQGPEPAQCPDASRLGSVEVDTPLLDHPVKGGVYLATPHENPFSSLLALYIALHDPESATVVKLAGEEQADPESGRLTSTFTENPQVPFEHFRVHFFGGAGGALRTPPTCGDYTTTSQMTPWSAPASGPPDTPSDTWSIEQGPGGTCAATEAELPHAPGFDAGAREPLAGHHSPFVVHLRREDGSQGFSAITVTPPPGLIGKLAGTATCPEEALAAAALRSGAEEQASPSCPAASRVGTVVVAAGAGPAPYRATGTAYLAAPYKGAPLSLAIVTPAVAGPFDLGTVVVRVAVRVNPLTGQLTSEADPIPELLQGIPLDVRSVSVSLDRPDFTLNPTSCDPMAVTGQLLSTLNQPAPLFARFQLAECGRLGFKPRMTLRLKGGTKRGAHPALTATLTPRAGDANIASLSLALPRSEFLEQAHIGTVCTRVQFAAESCPAASVYGTATVSTPILEQPLAGNLYLRSSENLLPDLVPDLRGPASQPIRIEAAGRTDSIRGGLRNSFDFVPDAPFAKLVAKLAGGRKGLLVNSRDVCAKTYRATVKYTAHNGRTFVARPKLRARCPKRGKGRRDGI